MSAAQTLDRTMLRLHSAVAAVPKVEGDDAFRGIVIGVAISLPVWAIIAAVGEAALSWV